MIIDNIQTEKISGHNIVGFNYGLFSVLEYSTYNQLENHSFGNSVFRKHQGLENVFLSISSYPPKKVMCLFIAIILTGLSMNYQINNPPGIVTSKFFTPFISFFKDNIDLFRASPCIRYNHVDMYIRSFEREGVPDVEDLFILSLLMIYKNRFENKLYKDINDNPVYKNLQTKYKRSHLFNLRTHYDEDNYEYKINDICVASIHPGSMAISNLIYGLNNLYIRILSNLPGTIDLSISFDYQAYPLFISSIGLGFYEHNLKLINSLSRSDYSCVCFRQGGLSYDPEVSAIITWIHHQNGNLINLVTDVDKYSRIFRDEFNGRLMGLGIQVSVDYYVIFRFLLDECMRFICNETCITYYSIYQHYSTLILDSNIFSELYYFREEISKFYHLNSHGFL
jgi:hypothetical protein